MCTEIRTVRVFFSAGKYSLCSVLCAVLCCVCEYGTCVCSLMSQLSALLLAGVWLAAAASNKLFSHIGQKSITLCFGPTLNRAQIFAMICIWSLTDFCSRVCFCMTIFASFLIFLLVHYVSCPALLSADSLIGSVNRSGGRFNDVKQ